LDLVIGAILLVIARSAATLSWRVVSPVVFALKPLASRTGKQPA
jgi:hypothetical protein